MNVLLGVGKLHAVEKKGSNEFCMSVLVKAI